MVRLHKAMQEKLTAASYSEQIQVLTLVPDEWYRKYCLEQFYVFEYLVWTAFETKNAGGISSKPAPIKGKTITSQTLCLVTSVYEDENFSR